MKKILKLCLLLMVSLSMLLLSNCIFASEISNDNIDNILSYEASERVFLGLTFAEIYQYTYNVTYKYSGKHLRAETKNAFVKPETFGLNQLMAVNSDGSIIVGNKENTKTKKYSSFSSYKSQLEKATYTC